MGLINLTDALPEDQALINGWTTGVINSLKGAANGLAPLGSDSKIDVAYLPTAALSTQWGAITGTLTDQTDLNNALASKANTASPAFSGVPTAPTADLHTSNLQIANTKFVKDLMLGMGWSETGTIQAPDAASGDQYSCDVSISRDGKVLAVGANAWEGAISNQGAVYIYDWDGSSWVQRLILTAGDAGSTDWFGRSVCLNDDGSMLVVGAIYWDHSALTNPGGVYTYDWNGSSFVQRGAVLAAADAASYDYFGESVSLSDNGLVLAVGAYLWEGATANQGGVYIFDWNGSAWVQRGAVMVASDAGGNDNYGQSISLSSDGSILAVGAPLWDVSFDEGQVYIYTWNGSAWSERNKITPIDALAGDRFGYSVALNGAGDKLAVGAPRVDQDVNTNLDEGSVYLYTWSGTAWSLNEKIFPSDTGTYNEFGSSVSFDTSGRNLVVGSEFWSTDGVNGYGKVYYGFVN